MEVLSKATVAANDIRLFAKVFSAPLKLMVSIAFAIGALIIGLIIYTATVERTQEYGVLKAIGTRNGYLYKIVSIQAVTSSFMGSMLGIGLASGIAQVIMAAQPQFLIEIKPQDILIVVPIGFAMAIIAGLLPIRMISGLSPAEVFRK